MEFYSHERLENWINRIKDTKNDESEIIKVFDYMMEDFAVACLNLINAVRRREVKKDDAKMELERVEKIISSTNAVFDDNLKNEMFEDVKESLKAIILSTKFYLDRKISKKSFELLLSEAVKNESKGNFDMALNLIAKMGAKILKGERLPEDLKIPESESIIKWLDGIDMINTVVILRDVDSQSKK